MSVANLSHTVEDLWNWPQDGMRHELINGEVTTMAPSGGEHSIMAVDIGILIAQFVKRRKLGLVFGADAGFIIRRNPDSVLAPDCAFVSSKNIPAGPTPRSFWPGPPDLAVEVVSPSDRPKQVVAKAQSWLDGGVQLVWVIHPRSQTLTVYAPNAQPRVLHKGDTLDGGDALPGFKLQVAELFRE